MQRLHPNRITKLDHCQMSISDLATEILYTNHSDGWRIDDKNNFSIISYAKFAEICLWPTPINKLNEHEQPDIAYLGGKNATISEGLATAMRIAMVLDRYSLRSQTYIVLISDGYDDNPIKTKEIINTCWLN